MPTPLLTLLDAIAFDPKTAKDVRSKVCTLRNLVEELRDDTRALWKQATGDEEDDLSGLFDKLESIADELAELEDDE